MMNPVPLSCYQLNPGEKYIPRHNLFFSAKDIEFLMNLRERNTVPTIYISADNTVTISNFYKYSKSACRKSIFPVLKSTTITIYFSDERDVISFLKAFLCVKNEFYEIALDLAKTQFTLTQTNPSDKPKGTKDKFYVKLEKGSGIVYYKKNSCWKQGLPGNFCQITFC